MSKGELKVTTFLVCVNPMLRAGLGHILANTRYEVRDQEKEIGRTSEVGPVMFIVDSNLKNALEATGIAALKDQHVDAKVVILADAFSLEQMMTTLKNGADGYCLPT